MKLTSRKLACSSMTGSCQVSYLDLYLSSHSLSQSVGVQGSMVTMCA